MGNKGALIFASGLSFNLENSEAITVHARLKGGARTVRICQIRFFLFLEKPELSRVHYSSFWVNLPPTAPGVLVGLGTAAVGVAVAAVGTRSSGAPAVVEEEGRTAAVAFAIAAVAETGSGP